MPNFDTGVFGVRFNFFLAHSIWTILRAARPIVEQDSVDEGSTLDRPEACNR